MQTKLYILSVTNYSDFENYVILFDSIDKAKRQMKESFDENMKHVDESDLDYYESDTNCSIRSTDFYIEWGITEWNFEQNQD